MPDDPEVRPGRRPGRRPGARPGGRPGGRVPPNRKGKQVGGKRLAQTISVVKPILLGIARPVVGGLLGLAVFAMFGSGWVSLPLVSEQTAGTHVGFLAFPGSGPGVLAGQLALFAIAFIAGLLEGIFIPAAGRGVARVANTVVRATTN